MQITLQCSVWQWFERGEGQTAKPRQGRTLTQSEARCLLLLWLQLGFCSPGKGGKVKTPDARHQNAHNGPCRGWCVEPFTCWRSWASESPITNALTFPNVLDANMMQETSSVWRSPSSITPLYCHCLYSTFLFQLQYPLAFLWWLLKRQLFLTRESSKAPVRTAFLL